MLRCVRIVLSRPQDPRNLGAVCRAMKTMGLTRLHVVGELPPDMDQAAIVSVHARDVLDGLTRHATLAQAVQGCALIIGVTRREGRWRKQSRLYPEDLPARVASCGGADVALVFGNEVSGLTDQELETCHASLGIPTSPAFPSLNLAQAVQIVAYTLHRGAAGQTTALPAIPQDRIELVTDRVMSVFQTAGFFRRGYDSGVRLLFRDLLARAALSDTEAARVERCFAILRSLVRSVDSDPRC